MYVKTQQVSKFTKQKWNANQGRTCCNAQRFSLVRRRRFTGITHSPENVNATGTAEQINIPLDVPTRQWVKWPQMNDHNAWKAFEEAADNALQTTLAGPISQKVELFTTIINTVGRETFGTEEGTEDKAISYTINKQTLGPNPQCKTGSEVNQKAVEKCGECEKEGLKAICDDLRKQLQSLQTAERNIQKRQRRAKSRS